MPLTLVTDCPHCSTKNGGFEYVAEMENVCKVGSFGKQYTLVFRCNSCIEVVCVKIQSSTATYKFGENTYGSIDDYVKRTQAKIVGMYPAVRQLKAPDHVSASVARCFVQGLHNQVAGHSDAAGAMFRKCIDLATKELDSALAGKDLSPRISALHARGLLTDGLKEWAHQVRLDGNEASHSPEELTPEEVGALASFTELFLLYAFTLPKQVAVRKADRLQR